MKNKTETIKILNEYFDEYITNNIISIASKLEEKERERKLKLTEMLHEKVERINKLKKHMEGLYGKKCNLKHYRIRMNLSCIGNMKVERMVKIFEKEPWNEYFYNEQYFYFAELYPNLYSGYDSDDDDDDFYEQGIRCIKVIQ